MQARNASLTVTLQLVVLYIYKFNLIFIFNTVLPKQVYYSLSD